MEYLLLSDLDRLVGGRLRFGKMPPIHGSSTPLGRVVTDSRKVEPGDVFWGLAGQRHDGSEFAEEALARGASGVVVAGRIVQPWAGRWSLEVPDTQLALWELASYCRGRFPGRVVAVTGSVGKTTTRQMIHRVLSSRFQGTASPKNYNTHIGLPLSMLNWSLDDDFAVVELGATGRGEIESLAKLCRPHVGVITRIGEAHLEGFGSQPAIASAKTELIETLSPSGFAVLNGDDPWLRGRATGCRAHVTWFGGDEDCEVTATNVNACEGKLCFSVEGQPFEVPVWGEHHVTPALAAIAVGRLFGITLDEASAALAEFEAPPHRCQVYSVGGVTLIDDTYNSSPSAMRAALELVGGVATSGRRYVVAGDMLELGASAEAWHRTIGEEVVNVARADGLWACGQFARDVVTGARDAGMPVGQALACREPLDVADALTRQLTRGDVVLVKGSNSLGMHRVVEKVTAAFASQQSTPSIATTTYNEEPNPALMPN